MIRMQSKTITDCLNDLKQSHQAFDEARWVIPENNHYTQEDYLRISGRRIIINRRKRSLGEYIELASKDLEKFLKRNKFLL